MILDLKNFPETPVPIEKQLKVQGLKNPICTVVLGLASDQVLRQLELEKKKDIRHIIVIEPDVGRFHAAIKRHYFGDLLSNPKYDFLIGTPLDQIKPMLFKIFCAAGPQIGTRASTSQQPEIIYDPYVYGPKGIRPPEESDFLIKCVTDAAQSLFLSMGCAADSYSRWEQTIKNKENLKTKLNLSPLKDKYKDYPAIVVGGGPSLDLFVKHCKTKEIHKKALVVACDAVLRRLKSEGIKPHIIVRCERKFTQIFEGIERKDTEGILYAGYNWSPPEFFDLFETSGILFRNNGICKWTKLSHLECNGGVSSGNACLELAWMLGCKTILLYGLDMVMGEGGKTHAEGSMVEFNVEKSRPKWQQIKCNDGQERTTIPVWYRCLNEYEGSISKYKAKKDAPEIFNMSKEGAVIAGAPYRDFKEVRKKFKKDFEWDFSDLKPVSEKEIKTFEDQIKIGLQMFGEVKKDLEKLFLFLDDAMENGNREEMKLLYQLKSHYNPTDMFQNFQGVMKSLAEMYRTPGREIDEIKTKWFTHEGFCNTLLDTVQLDLFKTENRVNALKNMVQEEYSRLKIYVISYVMLYRTTYYYNRRLTDLFEGKYDIDNSGTVHESYGLEGEPGQDDSAGECMSLMGS